MSKIVILGTTNSGKTCYFYGMLRKMLVGIHGFSIRPEDKDYAQLNRAIKRLNDMSVPVSERFPEATQAMQTYKLDLLYNFKSFESFDWDDYPGEMLSNQMPQFVESMAGAHCLFLCVDGAGIQEVTDDLDNLAEDLIMDWGCLELNNAIMQAEKKNDYLPPICIMVTKYDKIPSEMRNMETISTVLKKCFPNLFHKGGSGHDRMVSICPVTLGKDFDQGARMRPQNVEMPICFATYLIQYARVNDLRKQAKDLFEANARDVKKYDDRSFLGKIVHPKPQPLTEEQKQAVLEVVRGAEDDLSALREQIEPFPLYLNGEEISWQ